jgi:hypothetical protein
VLEASAVTVAAGDELSGLPANAKNQLLLQLQHLCLQYPGRGDRSSDCGGGCMLCVYVRVLLPVQVAWLPVKVAVCEVPWMLGVTT